MKPAQFSYAAWMMKSAESSAGFAPSTLLTQFAALSMMAGMALLLEVAPALRAHGPLHRAVDDGEHDRDRDGEAEHLLPQLLEVPLAVGELELRERRRLDQRAVGLDDLLLDHAHLGIDQSAVLDQVEALELDR